MPRNPAVLHRLGHAARATATRKCRPSCSRATLSRRWPNASRCCPAACLPSGQAGDAQGSRPLPPWWSRLRPVRPARQLPSSTTGRVHRVDGSRAGRPVTTSLNATQRARIAGLCAIRDHARALLDAQLAQDGRRSRLTHLAGDAQRHL